MYYKNIFSYMLAFPLLTSSNAFAMTYIKTCSALQNINQNLAEHYVLLKDIDCAGITFNPMGSSGNPFTGILNGAGHTISNLTINGSDNVALFSATKNAEIDHIKLNKVNITGSGSYLASLISSAYGTTINDVSVNGSVTEKLGNIWLGTPGNIGGLVGQLGGGSLLLNSSANITVSVTDIGFDGVGGLVGRMNDSSVDNSYMTGSVTGTQDGFMGIGGLIGEIDSGSVTNSYASGTVTAANEMGTGGLIGIIVTNENVNVANSKATGSVVITSSSSSEGIGGLIGAIRDDNSITGNTITISNCYATGSVGVNNTMERYIGGLVGDIYGNPSSISSLVISNSFATGKVTGNYASGGLIGNIDISITLSNTYSTGKVMNSSGLNSQGGLIGAVGSGIKNNIISSYWDTQTSGITSPTCGFNTTPDQCGTGKTTVEMYKQSTYIGWDFVNTWNIKEGSSYPRLVHVQ